MSREHQGRTAKATSGTEYIPPGELKTVLFESSFCKYLIIIKLLKIIEVIKLIIAEKNSVKITNWVS